MTEIEWINNQNAFPCPYIGKDKTCEECNCYRDDYWDEDKSQIESDCRDCKEYEDCPCGKDGHESETSQGYSIGECKDFELQERG